MEKSNDEEFVRFVFGLFDVGRKRTVDVKNIPQIFGLLGEKMAPRELEELSQILDPKKTGFLSAEDLLNVVRDFRAKDYVEEEKIAQAFRLFDGDNDGKINEGDLKFIFSRYTEGITDEDLRELAWTAGVNPTTHQIDYIKLTNKIKTTAFLK